MSVAVAESEDRIRFAPMLGLAMRRLREKTGMSQGQLAHAVKSKYVNRARVNRVETGKETTTATIDLLLEAMGYDARDLHRELGTLRVKRQGRRPISEPIQPPLAKVI